jgi:uncharacterized protein
LHGLLNIRTREDLESHPKIGASWEGIVIEQLICYSGREAGRVFFWATHAGAELDFLLVRGRMRWGFEIKRTSAPQVTPSMRSALTDLDLHRLDVIHAGTHTFPLAPKIRAVALTRLLRDID